MGDFDHYKQSCFPSGWAKYYLNYDLYDIQKDFVDSVDLPSAVVGKFCNEYGKTSIMGISLILWHMDTFPMSKTVYMTSTDYQLKSQLLPSLEFWVERFKGWRIKKPNKVYVHAPNDAMLLAYATKTAGYAEGHHERAEARNIMDDWTFPQEWNVKSENPIKNEPSLMIIVDECKWGSIADPIFEAIFRCHANRLIFFSSTGEPKGMFYNFFNSNRHREYFKRKDGGYNIFSATIDDCPHLKENKEKWEDLEKQIDMFGRESPFIKSTMYAEFAAYSEHCIFDMDSVNRAFNDIRDPVSYDLAAGVDLAKGGENKTTIAVRRGNYAWIEWQSREKDAIKLAKDIVYELERLGIMPENANFDSGGMGDAIIDVIDSLGYRPNRVNGKSNAIMKNTYVNKRAEMHYEFAKKLKLGKIRLKYNEALQKQFPMIKASRPDGKKYAIIPKDLLPESPDELDAICLAIYGMPEYKELETYVHRKQLKSATGRYEQPQEVVYAEDEGLFF